MSLWLLVLAAVGVAWWAWSRLRPDPLALSDRALVTGDLAPVFAALDRARPAEQPTAYHRVIRRLWDGYHREEAAVVARVLASHHRDAPVAQYWLKQLLQAEPEIAKRHLDEAFLQRFFDPGLAAKCGTYG